jgi:hypothetical protein
MIKKLLVICLLGLALIGNLQAVEPVPEMRDVEIKIVLLDVDEVNNVNQNFTANLATAAQLAELHHASNGIFWTT